MRTIVHVSDLHAGPPFDESIAAQLLGEVHGLDPDLLVVSGDLVEDYDRRQFDEAARYLRQFHCPLLMVPGNHDIPDANLLARLTRPYELYRRTFGLEQTSGRHFMEGLAVVGLNSVWTLSPRAGRLSRRELRRLRLELEDAREGDCRIAVMHHHLVPLPGFGRPTVVWGARRALRVLESVGIELVLSGHQHRSYIGNTLDFYERARRPIIVVQAGTATSRRGRGPEKEKNSYNVIRVTERTIRITHRLYFPDEGRFHRISDHLFPRFSLGATFLEPIEEVARTGAASVDRGTE